MNEWSPIKHMRDFSAKYWPQFQLPQFKKCKSFICTNPLLDRITENWKVILMDCSTVIAVSCFAATFFSGSLILCSAFAIIAISSGVSAFYMRRFSTLRDLETTAKGLKESKEKLEKAAKDLGRENHRLSENNRELQRTNEAFRATHRELESTNEAFRQNNVRLTHQVTQLTLQVTQLSESAERIKMELRCFQRENAHLYNNVRGLNQSLCTLDQQISASRALCEQINHHLASQEQGLGEQLNQLRQYLDNLSRDNRVHERIQELSTLQQQSQQAVAQLNDLRIQYATERANFQTIHEALVQLRNQFDAAIRDAASNLLSNNQQYRDNNQQLRNAIAQLFTDWQRIQQSQNRHFTGTPPANPPLSMVPNSRPITVNG
jgi:chromosome segregation ATPase